MERLPFAASTLGAAYEGLRLPAAVLLDNIRSLYNVGSFFRTADGAGVERLYLSGITGRPPRKELAKTALGAEERVAWEGVDDPLTLVDRLRAAHYEIAAIETSPRAVDLFDRQPRFPGARAVRIRDRRPARRSAGPLRDARPHPDARTQAFAERVYWGRRRVVTSCSEINRANTKIR